MLAAILASVASCTYDGPDAERFFHGRPSPYAQALNGVLNNTAGDLAAFLRVPSHVELHDWYEDTYRTDLNNVLRRREPEMFRQAYGLLTAAEKTALAPYLDTLDLDVADMYREVLKSDTQP